MNLNGIQVLGTGCFLPQQVATNDDFAKFVDTSDEWISTRTGMQRRHIATDEPNWYMGGEAARLALEAAGLEAAQIDLILFTTVTPDYFFPSGACLVQQYLGADNAFAMDVAAACAGSTYAYDMARRYLYTGGDVNNVLIVSAESLSQLTDYTDRATCVLFGDGAGAAVVTRKQGLYGSFLRSDSNGAKYIYVKRTRQDTPFGAAQQSSPHDLFEAEKREHSVMHGRDVYKFATKAMPEAVVKACEVAGIRPEQLDLVIPHQANRRIIETAIKNLSMDPDKFYINIHNYGNTSSASIAIALDECVRSGRLQPGHKVCMVGFGSGLTYGAVVFEF